MQEINLAEPLREQQAKSIISQQQMTPFILLVSMSVKLIFFNIGLVFCQSKSFLHSNITHNAAADISTHADICRDKWSDMSCF